jgi:hypothetical protein
MIQQKVNIAVAVILNNHKSRKNAIKFQDIVSDSRLTGATKSQVREAIKQLRTHRKPISSRPNVGYYLDSSEMPGCRKWVCHWRMSRMITPEIPNSLKWVS